MGVAELTAAVRPQWNVEDHGDTGAECGLLRAMMTGGGDPGTCWPPVPAIQCFSPTKSDVEALILCRTTSWLILFLQIAATESSSVYHKQGQRAACGEILRRLAGIRVLWILQSAAAGLQPTSFRPCPCPAQGISPNVTALIRGRAAHTTYAWLQER